MQHLNIPKTCFVLPDGHGLGGVTTWSIRMAEALTRRGHSCSILEHVQDTGMWREAVDANLPRSTLDGIHPGLAYLEDVRNYSPSYLAQLPATLIPNYTEGTFAACAEVARTQSANMRVLGFAHTDQDYYYDLLCRYEAIISTFVAVSVEIGEHLQSLLPHRATDVEVRPYGVAVPTPLRRTWSTSGRPLRLLFAGRLVKSQKRVLDLVRLARRLGKRDVDFVLDIVGEGPDEPELQSAIAELPPFVRARVMLLGRMPSKAMASLWQRTDVAVLVSEFEGTSIAMLEAMANGCVPVVTKVSGTSQAIEQGVNGFLAAVGDLDAMADAVQLLADDRQLLRKCGERAHQRSSAQFSLTPYVDWLRDISLEAWTKPPRPCPDVLPSLPSRPVLIPAAAPYVRYSLRRFLGKVRKRALAWMG